MVHAISSPEIGGDSRCLAEGAGGLPLVAASFMVFLSCGFAPVSPGGCLAFLSLHRW